MIYAFACTFTGIAATVCLSWLNSRYAFSSIELSRIIHRLTYEIFIPLYNVKQSSQMVATTASLSTAVNTLSLTVSNLHECFPSMRLSLEEITSRLLAIPTEHYKDLSDAAIALSSSAASLGEERKMLDMVSTTVSKSAEKMSAAVEHLEDELLASQQLIAERTDSALKRITDLHESAMVVLEQYDGALTSEREGFLQIATDVRDAEGHIAEHVKALGDSVQATLNVEHEGLALVLQQVITLQTDLSAMLQQCIATLNQVKDGTVVAPDAVRDAARKMTEAVSQLGISLTTAQSEQQGQFAQMLNGLKEHDKRQDALLRDFERVLLDISAIADSSPLRGQLTQIAEGIKNAGKQLSDLTRAASSWNELNLAQQELALLVRTLQSSDINSFEQLQQIGHNLESLSSTNSAYGKELISIHGLIQSMTSQNGNTLTQEKLTSEVQRLQSSIIRAMEDKFSFVNLFRKTR